jgi:putative hydrolase of the HAD superfamily
MPLHAVLFDLDDTLHDKAATLERFGTYQHEAQALSEHGVELEPWLKRYVTLNNERIEKTKVFATLAAEFGLSEALESALLSEFDADLGAAAVAYPGARELLAWCQESSLRVGIVTNGRDAFQRSKIKGMGLDPLVDAVLTSGGFGAKKPYLSIFRACLAELGSEPSDAAFVGDDFAADMQPALELGMVAVWRSSEKSSAVAFSSDSLQRIHAFLRGEA